MDQEIINALRIAIDEAEGWFDDSRGLGDGERMDELDPCYAVLDALGIKTLRAERLQKPAIKIWINESIAFDEDSCKKALGRFFTII